MIKITGDLHILIEDGLYKVFHTTCKHASIDYGCRGFVGYACGGTWHLDERFCTLCHQHFSLDDINKAKFIAGN